MEQSFQDQIAKATGVAINAEHSEQKALAEAQAQHDLRVELSNALREVRASSENDRELLIAQHAAEVRQLGSDFVQSEQAAVENTTTSAEITMQHYVRTKTCNLESESHARQLEVESLKDSHRRPCDEVQSSEAEAQRRHFDAVARATAAAQTTSATVIPCPDCPIRQAKIDSLTEELRTATE